MTNRRLVTSFFFLATIGCSEDQVSQTTIDSGTRTVTQDSNTTDVIIVAVQDTSIDMFIDPCLDIQNTDDMYCECHPRCCQNQTWYCPPRGTEVLAKDAVLDICDIDYVPCDRNIDESCPPAEIIYESSCNHMFDCPPGIDEDFTVFYDCEVDGNPGTQRVRCDKGRLDYGQCVVCILTDEICDGQDNDCDGEIDEHQLNECGQCGLLPQDICDGLDNDCDGLVDEDLVQACVTACERGVEVCENGAWTGCTARQPSEEICDGFDNDCDGLIDEELNCGCPPEMVGALLPCMEPPLTCGMGFKTCECEDEDCLTTRMSDCFALCAWLPAEIVQHDEPDSCDRYAGMPVNPEVCNNFDEDCDGLIDERLTKPCYSGPQETIGVGVCRGGSQVCEQGRWYGETTTGSFVHDFCAGETVPSREICDGSDNDCDGVTDFGREIPDTDILFILDWSGSMTYQINAVKMAMNRFANHFAAEGKLKWGLITGPRIFPREGQDPSQAKQYLRLETDITSFSDFIAAFSAAGTFETGATHEMLIDALLLSVATISSNMTYDLSTAQWFDGFSDAGSIPRLQDFRINWRHNADRVIVVFTDEEDQSFLVPKVTSEQAIAALEGSPDTTLYVFTQRYLFSRWDDYVDPTGGRLFPLSSNSEQMYDDLMSILDEICLNAGSSVQTEEASYNSNMSSQLYSPVISRYNFSGGYCY